MRIFKMVIFEPVILKKEKNKCSEALIEVWDMHTGGQDIL